MLWLSSCLPDFAGTCLDPLPESSYCDDTAVPVIVEAADIIDKSRMVTECAINVFSSYGLDLSFDPNKTNGVLYICGKNGRKVKRQICRQDYKVQLSTTSTTSEPIHLVYVNHYQHVGTPFSMSADLKQEVSTKCGRLRSGINKYGKSSDIPQFP